MKHPNRTYTNQESKNLGDNIKLVYNTSLSISAWADRRSRKGDIIVITV